MIERQSKKYSALRDWMHRSSGFTLTELMVVVAIMGIIVTMAVPAYLKIQPHWRLKSAVREVSDALQQARLAAISKNSSMKVVFDKNNDVFFIQRFVSTGNYETVRSHYDGEGWRPAADRWKDIDIYDPGSVPLAGTYLYLDSNTGASGRDGAVIFRPTGTTSMILPPPEEHQAVYMRNKRNPDEEYRVTIVGLTGLIKVQKKTDAGDWK